jgi:hypothetical protein
MKPRFVVPLFGALSFLALFSFAEEPRWYTQPGTPVTVEWSGFELRAMMPQGWAYTADHGFVPPPDFASSCRVRGVFHIAREWDRFLVSALRGRDGDERHVLKIGGHPAVSSRYMRNDRTIRNIYINLSDVRPDSGAVWTFEGSPTSEGSDCELQFVAMIQTLEVLGAPASRAG